MAHLLKHKDSPEPGVWRSAHPDKVRAWRERAHRNLMNKDGRIVTLEDNTAHHMGWEPAQVDQYGNPMFEKEHAGPVKPEDPRVVVDMNTRDLIDQMLWWSKHNPGLFREKIRLMKQTAGLSHLSDDDAAQQVHDLSAKVARDDTQRAHKQLGLTGGAKGAVILGDS